MVVTRSENADVKVFIAAVVLCLLFVGGSTAVAEPYLQLDATDAIYLGYPEESIHPTEPEFTLYALINADSSKITGPGPGGTFTDGPFYLSAAVRPKIAEGDGADLGHFFLDGIKISVTGDAIGEAVDMVFGAPPIGAERNKDQIAGHGIYDTYYAEVEFTLDPTKTPVAVAVYNSQDSPGGPDLSTSGLLYYEDFDVDVRGLPTGFAINFDLYTKDSEGMLKYFAPFSHDVVTVPTPGALMLGIMGIGMVNSFLRRKRSFVS